MKALIFALAGLSAAALFTAASHAQAVSTNFSMIIASDTQYPWTNCTDGDCEETEEVKLVRAYQLNVDHRDAMTALSAATGDVKGIIINGDLTAYGHPKELKVYKDIWYQSPLPLYEGLGNHDYLNNINDTFQNQAANGMMDYLYKRVTQSLGLTPDWSVKKGFMSKSSSGSLAYSWDVGDVHFVQLQNFPTYEKHWSTFVWTALTQKTYTVTHSLDWLEADLKAARENGKAVILNFHDTDEHWLATDGGFEGDTVEHRAALADRFSQILSTYQVSAVFAGHYHKALGQFAAPSDVPAYGDVPVFYSGSASQSLFLLAGFEGGNLTVTGYSSLNGSPEVATESWTVPLRVMAAD